MTIDTNEEASPTLMDLGPSDVHSPAAVRVRKRTMATIPTKKRNTLPSSEFALPAQRKYPINDAAHVRNAAARLEHEHKAGKISSGDYAKAKAAIERAAKKFGVHSEYDGETKPRAKRLHVRAELAEGGSLHVRHMSDRTVSLESVPVCLAEGSDDKKPVWIEVAQPGVFKGHPAGPFELNDQIFSEILRNFRDSKRPIPIDFEHASEAEATDGSIPVIGAPAQGWIVDLKIESGRLHGLVEWGDRAREYIRSGQYKFFSPAIRFNSKDRVTGQSIGARMTSGAMTNVPFLPSLKPLVAKDAIGNGSSGLVEMRGTLAHSPEEYMPNVRAALRMNDLSTARECSDQLGRLREHLDAVDGDHESSHEGIKLGDHLMPLRALVGAQPGATWEDILDVVQDLIDAAMDRHEVLDHGGLSGSTDAPMSDEDPEGSSAAMRDQEITMTVELSAKLTEITTQLAETKATLSDRETKLTASDLKAKDAETKNAELTLSLKEATTRADNAETELKTLREWKSQRDEKDVTDRVEEAFETYKDTFKLTADDKDAMRIVLGSKPELFEKKYPKVSPAQKPLLRNLTDKREPGTPAAHVDEGQAPGMSFDLAEVARTISFQRGIPLDAAQRIALKMAKAPAQAR